MTRKKDTEDSPRTKQSVTRWSELVAALAWGPKTTRELVEIVGAHEITLQLWLSELEASGMAYLADKGEAAGGVQGRKPQRWALQPRPFAYADFATPAEVVAAERKAFEAWAAPLGYDLLHDTTLPGEYSNPTTTALWRGWRARAGV